MAQRRRQTQKKVIATSAERMKYLLWTIFVSFLILLIIACWHYRYGIQYLISSKFSNEQKSVTVKEKHSARNAFLMEKYYGHIFGIDVSHYQGQINWDSVSTIDNRASVDFVVTRATMGAKAKDSQFERNWKSIQRRSKIRGAYHYYRPNENSVKQAKNFIESVTLEPGDLPPVLDIEERPKRQPIDSLRVGLKRWLAQVEKHYGVRPIIYSGDSYFTDFLENDFSDYVLWIANYNFWVERPKRHWTIWQFSEMGIVKGINTPVDLNMFIGKIEDLERLCVPYD